MKVELGERKERAWREGRGWREGECGTEGSDGGEVCGAELGQKAKFDRTVAQL